MTISACIMSFITSSPIKSTGRYAISLLILVCLWAAMSRLAEIPPYLLPDPAAVFTTLVNEHSALFTAAGITFSNMAIGASIGITLGLLIGGFVAYSPIARWVVEPYLVLFQSFPRESLFPLMVVWLGFGALPKIVNASLLSFFPTAMIALTALSDTRTDYIRLMETWKASKMDIYIYCRIPAAIPAFMGAVKIALPLALIGAVLGEFVGGNSGLGYIIITAGSNFRIDRMFAAIVILASGGVLMLAVANTAQKFLLSRYYQS